MIRIIYSDPARIKHHRYKRVPQPVTAQVAAN